MNNVILKSISIRNFKGIASLDISFDDKITKIYGKNGSGKSTIKNAWEWVLGQNVKDYLPNLNNEELPDLITSVEVKMLVNDLEYVLKRENKPKYNKEHIKTGNEAQYWVDDMEIGQKKYLAQVANIVGDVEFENLSMLTDKEFFNTDTNNWKWVNRRKILLGMTGAEATANELVKDEKYAPIRNDIIKGYSTSDIQSTINREKNSLKKQQESNLILIESKQKEIDEYLGIDCEKISSELTIAKTRFTKLINSSKNENATEELNKLNDEMLKLTQELSTVKTRDMLKVRDLEDFKLKIYREAIETKSEYDMVASNIKKLQENLEKLEKENIVDTCAMCGQKLPEDKIEYAKEQHSIAVLDSCGKLNSLKEKARSLYEKYNNLQKQYNAQEQLVINFVPDAKINELETKISELKSTIGSMKQSNLSNLSNSEIKSLETIISDLEREMAKKEYLEKGYKQIKVWREDNLKVAENILTIENKEIALQAFVKEQTDIIVKTVNSYFGNGVSWSLYSTNYVGTLDEDCVCLYNNKRYSSLSTGEKNIANMEVIKALQKFYNVSIPIFSDNSEANTIEYETDRQVIELYAKADTQIEGCVKITDLY